MQLWTSKTNIIYAQILIITRVTPWRTFPAHHDAHQVTHMYWTDESPSKHPGESEESELPLKSLWKKISNGRSLCNYFAYASKLYNRWKPLALNYFAWAIHSKILSWVFLGDTGKQCLYHCNDMQHAQTKSYIERNNLQGCHVCQVLEYTRRKCSELVGGESPVQGHRHWVRQQQQVYKQVYKCWVRQQQVCKAAAGVQVLNESKTKQNVCELCIVQCKFKSYKTKAPNLDCFFWYDIICSLHSYKHADSCQISFDHFTYRKTSSPKPWNVPGAKDVIWLSYRYLM